VGRFRQFVNAAAGGWTPPPGSGKHTHLNGGNGLIDSGGTGATFESGWQSAWVGNLATSATGWDTNLACAAQHTWTPSAASNESLPINCLTWYDAYAFCIRDGGFLPSEAEWGYAAQGGSEQRVYPWSIPPSSTTLDCSHANYGGTSAPSTCCVMPGTGATNAVGSESPLGDGKWGHVDMTGNVIEWALDYSVTQVNPCTDLRLRHGGVRPGGARRWFFNAPPAQLAASRGVASPTSRSNEGVRCARVP
jgi:formylglycine-generating enzyme required for sulfatase activity